MHFLHRKIKSDARKALSGNWGKAVASTMLFASICAFFYLLGKFFVKVLDITDTIDLLHVSAELRSGSYLPDILAFLLILFEIAAIFLIAAPIFLGILRWYSRTVLYGNEEITAIFCSFPSRNCFLTACS